ncbi:MAG: T9SS type A sorting domain-containing protein [Candidatus Cloacimonetes bacterium]|nr:T9SS type A sorting domain-containing protein [Candidatus Cloacimonadota bacterium]
MNIKVNILMFLCLSINLIFATINNIENISNEVLVYEYNIYNGAIFKYENRLYTQAQFRIEEYEIFTDGSLERISFLETRSSNRSFLVDSIIYSISSEPGSLLGISMIDVSQSPMKRIASKIFEVSSFSSSILFSSVHLMIVDSEKQMTILINKETLEIEGYIQGLYGYGIVISDSLMIVPYYYGNNEGTLLKFFEIDIENDYEMNQVSEIVLLGTFMVDFPEIQHGKYIFNHSRGVIIFDISDLSNPFKINDISTNYPVFHSILAEDRLFVSMDRSWLNVFELNEHNEYNLIYEDYTTYDSPAWNNMYYDSPFLYMNRYDHFMVFDTSNEFNNIFYKDGGYLAMYQFFVFNDGAYIVDFDVPIYLKSERNLYHYNIFSVFQNQFISKIEYDINMLPAFINIEHDLLYVAGTLVDDLNTYFEIYRMENQKAELINRYQIHNDICRGFFMIDDYLFFRYLSPDWVMVYKLDGYELDYIGLFLGMISIDKQNRYILNVQNNVFNIRDLDDYRTIIFSSVLPAGYNVINHYDDNLFLSFSSLNNDSHWRLFGYDLGENILVQIYDFPTTNVNAYNNVITINAYNDLYISEYFAVINGEVQKIGEKDDIYRNVGQTYFFPEKEKMVQLSLSGIWIYDIEYTVSENNPVVIPVPQTELLSNFPNPFNPETTIRFNIAVDSPVSIDIYNIRGQKVRRVFDGLVERGSHSVIWDGRDEEGRELGSGVYLYRMVTSEESMVRRMVLLR